MKTLAEVEPRTIVNHYHTPGDSGNSYIIGQPGSYYLTNNIAGLSGQNGIEITTNNVTLDLNGFALQGGPGADIAIYLPNAVENIAVRNGSVSGWGQGLVSWSYLSQNIVFEHLNVASNLGEGIVLNAPGEVLHCTSQANGGDGIDFNGGVVSDCTAVTNGGYGINGAFEFFGVNSDATYPWVPAIPRPSPVARLTIMGSTALIAPMAMCPSAVPGSTAAVAFMPVGALCPLARRVSMLFGALNALNPQSPAARHRAAPQAYQPTRAPSPAAA